MMARRVLQAAFGAGLWAASCAGPLLAAQPLPESATAAPGARPIDPKLSQVGGDMPDATTIILVLGGILASLILIRGPALRRAAEQVKRMPGDAH